MPTVLADANSAAARNRESSGSARGTFLDDRGRPLAWSRGGPAGPIVVTDTDSIVNVTGYRDAGGAWHGLQLRFNRLLDAAGPRADWRTFFLHLIGHTAQGGDVGLTIDRSIQRVADRALGRGRGAVVVLDPRTGAVLALVSRPACTARMLATAAGLDACQTRSDSPLLNRATQLLVAPGSSFKIVTISAALQTGRFSLGSIFSGVDVFGPSPYFDNLDYPSNITRADITQVNLAQALAFSDNFVFAHIGLTLGSTTLLRFARRFALDQKVPFDLPTRVSTIASGRRSLTARELAQSSFGAAVDQVTPLYMALIVSAIANHGTMMSPYLVRNVRLADGSVVYRNLPHVLKRVITPRTSRLVAQAMTFVVDHGSGYRAQIAGMQVAGKTGTAASGRTRPNAWFLCFAPARHPVVAVAVLRQFSGEGAEYAAPVARKVLVAALRQRGLRVK